MVKEGVENYMLPCLNKKLFGIECLGCGAQRATVFLFKGDFIAAFKMYPAIYTLIILGVFLLTTLFIKIKYANTIKIGLIVLNILIIVVSYVLKMNNYF